MHTPTPHTDTHPDILPDPYDQTFELVFPMAQVCPNLPYSPTPSYMHTVCKINEAANEYENDKVGVKVTINCASGIELSVFILLQLHVIKSARKFLLSNSFKI